MASASILSPCSFFHSVAARPHRSRRGAETIRRLTAQLKLEPLNTELLMKRAAIHLESGDWRECLADIERAERLGTSGAEVLRARALLAGGFPSHALATLHTVPNNAEVLWAKSDSLSAANQKAAATQMAWEALHLMPKPEPDDWIRVLRLLKEAGKTVEMVQLLESAPPLPAIQQNGLDLALETAGVDCSLRLLAQWSKRGRLPEPLQARHASLLARAGRLNESLLLWKEISSRSMNPGMRTQSAKAIAALQSIRFQP